MMITSRVITISDHAGWAETNARLTIALTTATTTAVRRATALPRSSPAPVASATIPRTTCAQPPGGVVHVDDQPAGTDHAVLVPEQGHRAVNRVEAAQHDEHH